MGLAHSPQITKRVGPLSLNPSLNVLPHFSASESLVSNEHSLVKANFDLAWLVT